MKYYALLHAVCGLAEGYSDTTVRWFNDLDKAMEAKRRTLESLMCRYEEVTSTTDGMQDIITIDSNEGAKRRLSKSSNSNPYGLSPGTSESTSCGTK